MRNAILVALFAFVLSLAGCSPKETSDNKIKAPAPEDSGVGKTPDKTGKNRFPTPPK